MASQVEPRTGETEAPNLRGAQIKAPVARFAAARVRRTGGMPGVTKPVRQGVRPTQQAGYTARY